MRIIAGEKGGLRIQCPPGRDTRPTLERVRESLFMTLEPHLEGAVALDLFAGAGALGFEALSRGAARAVFVERGHQAIKALEANARHLGYKKKAEIVEADATRWLARADLAGPQKFDLVFIDPPYGRDLLPAALDRLAKHAAVWLAPRALVVAQGGRRDPAAEAHGPLISVWAKTYGDTLITIYRYDAGPGGDPGDEPDAAPEKNAPPVVTPDPAS